MLPAINTSQFYIDGKWTEPVDAKAVDIRSPAGLDLLCRMPLGGAGDIDRAVKAARKAFDETRWPWLPIAERVRYVAAMADELERRLSTLTNNSPEVPG